MSETPDELRTQAEDLRDHFNSDYCIDALLARLATAEADADRLAEAMRNTVEEFYGEDGHTYNPDETECLRLHDEAVARREQP